MCIVADPDQFGAQLTLPDSDAMLKVSYLSSCIQQPCPGPFRPTKQSKKNK